MNQQTRLQEVSPIYLDQAIHEYGITMMAVGMSGQHVRDHDADSEGSMEVWTVESDEKVKITLSCTCQGDGVVFAEASLTRRGLKEVWQETIRSVLEHDQASLGGAR